MFTEDVEHRLSYKKDINIPRMLTIFNSYFLKKKLVEAGEDIREIGNFNWRDATEEGFSGLPKIKKELNSMEGDYLNFYEKINLFKSGLETRGKYFRESLNLSFSFWSRIFCVEIVFCLIGFGYYARKYIPEIERKGVFSTRKKAFVSSPSKAVVSGVEDWNFCDLLDDFILECELNEIKASIRLERNVAKVTRDVYYRGEKILRPLLQILKVVSHKKDDVEVNMNVWCSKNKICLITDFVDINLSKNLLGNHKLAEKFLRIEQLLGDFNGQVKLFKFNSSGVSRISIEFYPKFRQSFEHVA